MALQPIKRSTQGTQPAAAPVTTPAAGRPTPRATPQGRPATRPVAQPTQPARRGEFLRGVVPGGDRYDPHFKSHGRYIAELVETQLFPNRDKNGSVFLATFKVIEVLNPDSVKRVGDKFNILFTTKNMDVYKGSMARLVVGLCKPTEDELAADMELPEDEQSLMVGLLDSLLDGELNGYQYDLEFVGAVSTKGAEYTDIRYGDATPPQ